MNQQVLGDESMKAAIRSRIGERSGAPDAHSGELNRVGQCHLICVPTAHGRTWRATRLAGISGFARRRGSDERTMTVILEGRLEGVARWFAVGTTAATFGEKQFPRGR